MLYNFTPAQKLVTAPGIFGDTLDKVSSADNERIKMPTSRVTTMAELLKDIAEHVEKQTPEEKARTRAELLKWAEGKKRRGEWIN